jgi:hypothetical protein
MGDDKEEEQFEVIDGSQVLSSTSALPDVQPPGKKKIRALFGQKRTHNEQIIVAPCGIILAWETFYGAEAITTVVVSIHWHF